MNNELKRASAPFIATLIFWIYLEDAWFTLLAYHVQIRFWQKSTVKMHISSPISKDFLLILPSALSGVFLYYLIPYITKVDISNWLICYKLETLPMVLLIPYFGIIHPILEQMHWQPLWRKSKAYHLLFAGYHLIILHSLLSISWLLVVFIVLTSTSYLWAYLALKYKSLTIPILFHIFSDLSIILAVYSLTN